MAGRPESWLFAVVATLAALAAAPGGAAAAVPQACPGRAIAPDRVITGSFGQAQARSYVMLPFAVPRGTTAVRVKYCYDQPELPVSTPLASARNTLDLGLYGPRRDPGRTWGVPEFRGWGGSSHPDVTVSAEGYSTEAQYTASPRVEVPGKTTRAFLPGPIRPGEWAVELGVGGVVSPALGNLDGRVAWRVEIELARDPSFADQPYRPARYDRRPARTRPGWYAGDLHMHAEQSAYGDATMREAFGYAFRPLSAGGAGLDFLTLTDYVSGGAWGEIGRLQRHYPGKLVSRGAEVITYRGHLNAQAAAARVDYRTGPIFERAADGNLRVARAPRPPSEAFAGIRRAGGFTQINHPTIFPSQVPLFDLFCRGCPWDYGPPETGYDKVDAIEVATGPPKLAVKGTSNPFTLTAVDFYERALARGARAAAVGVSDSHKAGRVSDPVTGAPIGTATTVVRAEELSEPGIECGVKAGHTYVKVTGNGGPDLRLEARPAGWAGAPAIFGDSVRGSSLAFTARVTGGPGRTLQVVRDGAVVRTLTVPGADATLRFTESVPGRYGLRLFDGAQLEAVSTPIWFSSGPPAVSRRDCAPLRVRGKVARRVRATRSGRLRVRCAASGARVRPCRVRALIAVRRRGRLRTVVVGSGRARAAGGSRRIWLRLNRAGRRVVGLRRRGRRMRVVFSVDDGDGATASVTRRTRVLAARRRASR